MGESKLLVPFSGSGSELIGGLQAGWTDVVGIELDTNYVSLAHQRIDHWCSPVQSLAVSVGNIRGD
jgi:DNA modification methylase